MLSMLDTAWDNTRRETLTADRSNTEHKTDSPASWEAAFEPRFLNTAGSPRSQETQAQEPSPRMPIPPVGPVQQSQAIESVTSWRAFGTRPS